VDLTNNVKVFRASRNKLFAVAGVLALFAATVLKRFEVDRLAIVSAGVLALIALLCLFLAVRGEPVLRLDQRGFEQSSLFSTRLFAWNEHYEFHVVSWGVGYLRHGFGSDHLLLNLFAANSTDICEALQEWKKKYGAQPPNTSFERTRGR